MILQTFNCHAGQFYRFRSLTLTTKPLLTEGQKSNIVGTYVHE